MIEHNAKCIGTAGLHHILMNNNNATFSIGIWDISSLSKGIGSTVTKLVLQYAFDCLRLHRIELKVLD